MTSVATCRKYQFVIALPKAVPIAYPRSEFEMQRNCVLLFHKHNFELFEPRNPRQEIAYSFFHCYGPIFWTKQLWARFGSYRRNPHKYQEDRYKNQKATEC